MGEPQGKGRTDVKEIQMVESPRHEDRLPVRPARLPRRDDGNTLRAKSPGAVPRQKRRVNPKGLRCLCPVVSHGELKDDLFSHADAPRRSNLHRYAREPEPPGGDNRNDEQPGEAAPQKIELGGADVDGDRAGEQPEQEGADTFVRHGEHP